jgi:hypothetical protein
MAYCQNYRERRGKIWDLVQHQVEEITIHYKSLSEIEYSIKNRTRHSVKRLFFDLILIFRSGMQMIVVEID